MSNVMCRNSWHFWCGFQGVTNHISLHFTSPTSHIIKQSFKIKEIMVSTSQKKKKKLIFFSVFPCLCLLNPSQSNGYFAFQKVNKCVVKNRGGLSHLPFQGQGER